MYATWTTALLPALRWIMLVFRLNCAMGFAFPIATTVAVVFYSCGYGRERIGRGENGLANAKPHSISRL
jgi:hypothetical protein